MIRQGQREEGCSLEIQQRERKGNCHYHGLNGTGGEFIEHEEVRRSERGGMV
jgi:hypothetical protein